MNPTEAHYLSMRHFVNFNIPFSAFGELNSARDAIARKPSELIHVYGTYRQYVKRLMCLTKTDREMLEKIREKHPSHRGALHFIEKMGEQRLHELKGNLDRAVHPDATTNRDTVNGLYTKMLRATELVEDPHDAPYSVDMIYGYRFIKDNEGASGHNNFTEAQIHFMVCHFLQLALFQSVPQVKWYKDDFIGAIGDVMMLVDVQSYKLGEEHISRPEYKIWARPKDDGGLGWIPFKYSSIVLDYALDQLMKY